MVTYIITVEREETTIHKVNFRSGEYLRPKKITGSFKEQSKIILSLIHQEKPYKLIIEKIAVGLGLYDSLVKAMNDADLVLHEDGTILRKL